MKTQSKINSKRPKENPARKMTLIGAAVAGGTGLIGAVVGVFGTVYATTMGVVTADETLRDNIALEIMKSAEPVEKISDKLNWLINMKLVEHVEPTRSTRRTGREDFRQAELAHQYETGGTR